MEQHYLQEPRHHLPHVMGVDSLKYQWKCIARGIGRKLEWTLNLVTLPNHVIMILVQDTPQEIKSHRELNKWPAKNETE